jgi:type II secretory pathway component PulJ
MTLLEAVIAFVVLSLAGVVCLDQARGASQLQRSSAEWTQAIARGEAALAEEVARSTPSREALPALEDPSIQVQRSRWRPGLDVIEVSVPLAGGRTYTLSRLVPTTAGASR